MLTRLEINGFKTFQDFKIDFGPFSAIVGPNATGKSNLFDAIRLLSLLAQHDIPTAMQDLRGQPEELFRQTPSFTSDLIALAVEVFLPISGTDAFGQSYSIKAQRLRYEISIRRRLSASGEFNGIFIDYEYCCPLKKSEESSPALRTVDTISYGGNLNPFLTMREKAKGTYDAIEIRQDGPRKRGRPVTLAATDASRSGLSTISTAEFPHLYALKTFLSSIRFLQIDPQAARRPADRLARRTLEPDASNLATVLARIQSETRSIDRPTGALSDIASDLASLIPSVNDISVDDDQKAREYSFDLIVEDGEKFSSRIISDGTLRLLALITLLNDPERFGVLCFEEPENGVHEGRIPQLIRLLRHATADVTENSATGWLQIITNTHSPAVMGSLRDNEIIAADLVNVITPHNKMRAKKTRMRTGVVGSDDLIESGRHLTRFEIDHLLRRKSEAA